ncbi:hypothetical protein AB4Z40_27260 [Bosea sp. 2YAB26]|uniref:hypothetical protein n=1 Tax=Bosea sp. 2YAB26 TaxID=3237478 RepID=UPI003F911FB1
MLIQYGTSSPDRNFVVTINGKQHAYGSGSYFIAPDDDSAPTFFFQSNMTRWTDDSTKETVTCKEWREPRS